MLKTTCFHNNEYASLWSCICFCCVCICLYVRFSTDPCFPSELQWVSESNLVSVDWIDQCKDLLYSFDQAASVVYSDKRVMEFVFISSLLTEDIFVYHCILCLFFKKNVYGVFNRKGVLNGTNVFHRTDGFLGVLDFHCV